MLSQAGVDAVAWVLALATVAPLALLIPGIGFGWWPLSSRLAFGACLGVGVFPLIQTAPETANIHTGQDLVVAAAQHALNGVPVVLGAAILLWATAMAAGVYDWGLAGEAGVGTPASGALPNGGLQFLLPLCSLIIFLELHGPVRLAAALIRASELKDAGILQYVASQLLASIELAVGIAAPILVVVFATEVALGVARGASGQQRAAWGTLRPLIVLILCALVLSRVLEEISAYTADRLGPE